MNAVKNRKDSLLPRRFPLISILENTWWKTKNKENSDEKIVCESQKRILLVYACQLLNKVPCFYESCVKPRIKILCK